MDAQNLIHLFKFSWHYLKCARNFTGGNRKTQGRNIRKTLSLHCGKGTPGHQRKDGLAMPSTCKWHEGSCFFGDAQQKWSSSAYHRSKLHQVASPELQQLKSLLMSGSLHLGGIWSWLQKGPQGVCGKLTADLQSSMSVSPMPWQQTPFKDTVVFLPTELPTFFRAVRAFQPQLVWSFSNSYW